MEFSKVQITKDYEGKYLRIVLGDEDITVTFYVDEYMVEVNLPLDSSKLQLRDNKNTGTILDTSSSNGSVCMRPRLGKPWLDSIEMEYTNKGKLIIANDYLNEFYKFIGSLKNTDN